MKITSKLLYAVVAVAAICGIAATSGVKISGWTVTTDPATARAALGAQATNVNLTQWSGIGTNVMRAYSDGGFQAVSNVSIGGFQTLSNQISGLSGGDGGFQTLSNKIDSSSNTVATISLNGFQTLSNKIDSASNVVRTASQPALVLTSTATAASHVVDMSQDNQLTITNAVASDVTVLLTNCTAGKYGILYLTSDNSARTISFYSGATLKWISTNSTSSGTNLLTVASKVSVVSMRVYPGAGVTNVLLFAATQP